MCATLILQSTPSYSQQAVTKAVLVTGASSGIGRRITELLAKDGYFVYAGARKADDLKALDSIPNVKALRLDVTKPDEATAAVEIITKEGRGLYGLVNNAGVVTVGSVEETPWNEFDLVMQVNVYGTYRITRAFMPLIAAQKGRIVNVGSISAVLAGAGMSAYAMSKNALEAFTDCLAKEMGSKSVGVSVIEPGDYASEIWKKAARRSRSNAKFADYAHALPEPDDVARATEEALSAPRPKRRYLVVPNQQEANVAIAGQIERLVQMNEMHQFSFDRDSLVRMLDGALIHTRQPNR